MYLNLIAIILHQPVSPWVWVCTKFRGFCSHSIVRSIVHSIESTEHTWAYRLRQTFVLYFFFTLTERSPRWSNRIASMLKSYQNEITKSFCGSIKFRRNIGGTSSPHSLGTRYTIYTYSPCIYLFTFSLRVCMYAVALIIYDRNSDAVWLF